MGIALFTVNSLFAPLQGLVSWLSGRPASTPVASRFIASQVQLARPAGPKPSPKAVARPLRVLRVVDAGQPPAGAGRMVISGRLADVCAELDRLAALEAATPA